MYNKRSNTLQTLILRVSNIVFWSLNECMVCLIAKIAKATTTHWVHSFLHQCGSSKELHAPTTVQRVNIQRHKHGDFPLHSAVSVATTGYTCLHYFMTEVIHA